jgi:hypothetical protein
MIYNEWKIKEIAGENEHRKYFFLGGGFQYFRLQRGLKCKEMEV